MTDAELRAALLAMAERFHAGPGQRVLREAAVRLEESVRHRRALERIRTLGAVCPEYATCAHPACRDSHAAWTVADVALGEETDG